MARTINLTSLVITRIELDYVQNRVVAWFDIRDDAGAIREQKAAFFWVTMPVVPEGQSTAKENFLLPASYFPGLIQLRADAQAALESRYLV